MDLRFAVVRERPREGASHGSELDRRDASQSRIASRLLPTFLVLVLVALIGLVFWASRRGFDLTDEGYYLQLYAHPESAPARVVSSQFFLLVALLTGPLNLGIVGYRICGLMLLLGSAGFFGLSFHRFASKRIPEIAFPSRLVTTCFVAISGLLGYSWAPLAVSYNTLAATVVHVIAGLVLVALAGPSGMPLTRSRVLQMATAGALLPLLFYIKWPASLA